MNHPSSRTAVGPKIGVWGAITLGALGLYGVWMPMAGFEPFRGFVDAGETVSVVALALGLVSAGLVWRLSQHVTRAVRRMLAVGTILALVSSGAFVHYVFLLSADLPEPPRLAVGELAPPLVGQDFLGESFDGATLRGRPAVVLFYRGHW